MARISPTAGLEGRVEDLATIWLILAPGDPEGFLLDKNLFAVAACFFPLLITPESANTVACATSPLTVGRPR